MNVPVRARRSSSLERRARHRRGVDGDRARLAARRGRIRGRPRLRVLHGRARAERCRCCRVERRGAAPAGLLDGGGERARALAVATDNGFANNPSKGTTVKVTSQCEDSTATGPKSNQLRVQVTKRVDTLFGRIFGINALTVRRVANAEFDPPINLGNPTSNFGAAPDCPSCSQGLMFANMASQFDPKVNGNAIAMDWCGRPADNCQANLPLNNKDRDTNGELFEIDNPTQNQLVVHLFDPAFIDDGDTCQGGVLYGQYAPGNPNAVFPPNVWGTNWLKGGSAWLAGYTGVGSDRALPADSGQQPELAVLPGRQRQHQRFLRLELESRRGAPDHDAVEHDVLAVRAHRPVAPVDGPVRVLVHVQGLLGTGQPPAPQPVGRCFGGGERGVVQQLGQLHQPRRLRSVDADAVALRPAGPDRTGREQTGRRYHRPERHRGPERLRRRRVRQRHFGCSGGLPSPPAADGNVAVSAITKMGLSVHTNAGAPPSILPVCRRGRRAKR